MPVHFTLVLAPTTIPEVIIQSPLTADNGLLRFHVGIRSVKTPFFLELSVECILWQISKVMFCIWDIFPSDYAVSANTEIACFVINDERDAVTWLEYVYTEKTKWSLKGGGRESSLSANYITKGSSRTKEKGIIHWQLENVLLPFPVGVVKNRLLCKRHWQCTCDMSFSVTCPS